MQYPNREQVCRELPPPRSIQELRDALEVFDDQQILAQHARHNGNFSMLETVGQLYDGAVLRVAVPRRRIFVSMGNIIREKSVVWYPGATADQIEKAIVKACGLPLDTSIELLDGDVAVVISATIPNDSSFSVVPFLDGASANGSIPKPMKNNWSRGTGAGLRERHGSARPNKKLSGREHSSTNAASTGAPMNRSPSARSVGSGADRPSARSRSATPQGNRAAWDSGFARRPPSRGASPTRSSREAVENAAMPAGRISAPDEHCVHILAGHGGFVFCLVAVGDVLFTGSQDANIMIWDLNNLQYIGTLPGHKGFVKCLEASYARKLLFSGSQDKTIKVWSLDTFSAVKTLFGHGGEVNSMLIIDNLDALISGAEDRSIRVWDLASYAVLATLEAVHLGGVFSLASLDEQHMLSGSRDRSIKVWNATTWQTHCTLSPPHYDGVTALSVCSNSGRFYSASRDKSIKRWDSKSLECVSQITHAHGDWLTSLACSESEQTLFSGGKDCIVKVWDAELRCQDHLLGHRGAISALRTINGHLFSASHDRTVRVWRVEQYER